MVKIVVDLSHPPTAVSLAGAELVFDGTGEVVLRGRRGKAERGGTGLGKGTTVVVWSGDVWSCFVGLTGTHVYGAWPSDLRLDVVVDLDRFDLGNRYDPGGLHYVEFIEAPRFGLLLIYERGLALMSVKGVLIWQSVHGDLTARLRALGTDAVTLIAETGPLTYRLGDGGRVHSSSDDPSGAGG